VESVLAVELGPRLTIETCRSVGSVARIGFGRTRDAVYWQSATFPARRLARLVAGVAIPGPGEDAAGAPDVATHGADRPGATRSWPPFAGLVAAVIRRVVDRVVFEAEWAVFTRTRGRVDPPPRDLGGFQPVPAPAGRFYADPFVVAERGEATLYVEDCPNGAHRGRISALRGGPDGRWTGPTVVLADLEHRAYPHVAVTTRGLLLTPDSGRAGGVDVFRREGEDGAWVPAGRWLEGLSVSDPTLLERDGRLWLFVAMTGRGMNPWDELHLYSAPGADGPWTGHPLNPIVADCRRARPAGRIFESDGLLLRPGQDCSIAYGRRIVLSAIRTMTTTDYAEEPVAAIEPDGIPGVSRTHTYSVDGTIEALDGYRRRRRFPSVGRPSR
jgi:hypothetical protein